MNYPVQRISLIGFGNVGAHLYRAFCAAGIEVSHVLLRKAQQLNQGTTSARTIDELPENQLVLLCVPDDAIEGLIHQLGSRPIAYTSGSVVLDQLPMNENLGVFYPLQTFSAQRAIDISEVPFFIEARNEAFGLGLFHLARKLSATVAFADSTRRKDIHLAAVWINNFTNHMVYRAQDFALRNAIDPEIFQPLLKETVFKLAELSAKDAQTGPARRGDLSVIEQHKMALSGTEKDLYALISKSILQTYSDDEQL